MGQLPDDNTVCKGLVDTLLKHCSMVGYGEIRYRDDASFYGWIGQTSSAPSSLQYALQGITHPRLLSVTITHKEELFRCCRPFCNRGRRRMFEERVATLETLAREQGLDFFPVSFEVVPQDIMTEVAAYGLPTRARHWSYGKVYQHQHLYGTMGLSKIYEIVLNSDPGLAFLLDSNPEIANLLVAAHVFAHVDFFKNNLCFADTNRRMVNDAVAHALRIDAYIERYGLEVVEHLMDIGFALDRHTDPHKGLLRQPYPPRRVVEKEHMILPYDDLMDTPTRSITYTVEGERLPPHPERDLLWFLITYAPLRSLAA